MACSASSFNKHLLRAYSLPSTMLDVGEKNGEKARNACVQEFTVLRETFHTQTVHYNTAMNTTVEEERGPGGAPEQEGGQEGRFPNAVRAKVR